MNKNDEFSSMPCYLRVTIEIKSPLYLKIEHLQDQKGTTTSVSSLKVYEDTVRGKMFRKSKNVLEQLTGHFLHPTEPITFDKNLTAIHFIAFKKKKAIS